jgi:flagellar hook-basal body complex protein FliE
VSVQPIFSQKNFIQPTRSSGQTETRESSPFHQLLKDAVSQTNETDAASTSGNLELLTQQGADLHTILINAEKADIALQYTLQIRNKLLDAYNEIMRMQI